MGRGHSGHLLCDAQELLTVNEFVQSPFGAPEDSGSAMRALKPSLLAPCFDVILNAGQPIDPQDHTNSGEF